MHIYMYPAFRPCRKCVLSNYRTTVALKDYDVMHACKIENGEQSEPRTSGRLFGYATAETACILLQRCVQGVQ